MSAFADPGKLLRTGLAGILLASMLVLTTGCAPDIGIPPSAGSGSSSGDVSGDDSTLTEEGDGSEEQDSADATGLDCLPGDWLLDNAEFGRMMSAAAGEVVTVEGTAVLTLGTDGKTSTAYGHWSHTLRVHDVLFVIERHGTDRGTYVVSSDGTMMLTDSTIGSTTTMRMAAAGRETALTAEPEPSIFDRAAFTCSGDTLTFTADGATAVMHRQR